MKFQEFTALASGYANDTNGKEIPYILIGWVDQSGVRNTDFIVSPQAQDFLDIKNNAQGPVKVSFSANLAAVSDSLLEDLLSTVERSSYELL